MAGLTPSDTVVEVELEGEADGEGGRHLIGTRNQDHGEHRSERGGQASARSCSIVVHISTTTVTGADNAAIKPTCHRMVFLERSSLDWGCTRWGSCHTPGEHTRRVPSTGPSRRVGVGYLNNVTASAPPPFQDPPMRCYFTYVTDMIFVDVVLKVVGDQRAVVTSAELTQRYQ